MTVRRGYAQDPEDRPPLPDSDKAALICRQPKSVGEVIITFWDSLDDALEAHRTMDPCDRRCVGEHSVAVVHRGRIRSASLPSARPSPPDDLAQALAGDQDALDRLAMAEFRAAAAGDAAAITRLRDSLPDPKGRP